MSSNDEEQELQAIGHKLSFKNDNNAEITFDNILDVACNQTHYNDKSDAKFVGSHDCIENDFIQVGVKANRSKSGAR